MVSYNFTRISDGEVIALGSIESEFIDEARQLFDEPDRIFSAIGGYRMHFELLCMAGISVTSQGNFNEDTFIKCTSTLSPELTERYRIFLQTKYRFQSWATMRF